MLEIIKDKGLLTLQMIEETFVAYEYEVRQYSVQDSSVIQIKSYTLHPDYAAFLNTNYVNTVKEDFIPVETVGVPEEPQVLADVVPDKTESISWN
jgi:O-glycosyl hydrolase